MSMKLVTRQRFSPSPAVRGVVCSVELLYVEPFEAGFMYLNGRIEGARPK
jgi:hypothetical protein